MVEDDPIVMLDSLQLEYATPPRQIPGISKVANANPNMRQKHGWNIASIPNQNTMDDNKNIINI